MASEEVRRRHGENDGGGHLPRIFPFGAKAHSWEQTEGMGGGGLPGQESVFSLREKSAVGGRLWVSEKRGAAELVSSLQSSWELCSFSVYQ